MKVRACRLILGLALAAALGGGQSAQARPAEHVTYLLPAPESAIVFAPFVLASRLGLYARQGLEVSFVTVPGGMNVGAALARGEGDLGGATGDTAMQLRSKGMAVRGVALLGHHAFLTLVTRQGLAIDASLKGREIDVPSLKDTSYYGLTGLLQGVGLEAGAVRTEARPVDALVDALGHGRIDGFVGTVDWGVRAERMGATCDYRSLDAYYPALAQAILASDATIRKRPHALRRFIRATLEAMRRIGADPAQAARDYAAARPDSGYSYAEIARIFALLGDKVYGPVAGAGRFNPGVMAAAGRANIALGIVRGDEDIRASFTNRFVDRRTR
ncbi:ABC transporter substrate-binding protein [Novosphingobium rosa]|uniref:ABC transporter substrate-binding protein n=1 Tax=Novosphingobium rosa TaxID=76978 RepID=UPI0009FECAAF|nr:ABC transporter substrate-binding protein [Novosphingobium rosa]